MGHRLSSFEMNSSSGSSASSMVFFGSVVATVSIIFPAVVVYVVVSAVFGVVVSAVFDVVVISCNFIGEVSTILFNF